MLKKSELSLYISLLLNVEAPMVTFKPLLAATC